MLLYSKHLLTSESKYTKDSVLRVPALHPVKLPASRLGQLLVDIQNFLISPSFFLLREALLPFF